MATSLSRPISDARGSLIFQRLALAAVSGQRRQPRNELIWRSEFVIAACFADLRSFHRHRINSPETGVSVTFPNLNSPPFGGEEFQTNLIMPEPCPFLSRKLPPCSIIRPTETKGIARGVVKFLTDMGLFIGQSQAFFEFLNDLAEDADEARRGR
jgi:hypothetical protein